MEFVEGSQQWLAYQMGLIDGQMKVDKTIHKNTGEHIIVSGKRTELKEIRDGLVLRYPRAKAA